MKIVENIMSKFPILNRPTPMITAIFGQSEQVATLTALGTRMLRKGITRGVAAGEQGIREGIRERIANIGRDRPVEKAGRSESPTVSIRQRIFERTSGCTCRCGK